MNSPISETASIIIATFNRPGPLRETLESVGGLDPKPLEVLVIDQTEDLPEEETTWRRQHLDRYPEVRFIQHSPPNAQAARNRGIVEARGSVVLLMDDDVQVPPDLIEQHLRNYEDPTLAAVSGLILEPDQEPTQEFPREFHDPKIGFCFFPLNYGARTEAVNLSSCNCSVRREHALAVGGFDENFTKTLFDDTDFGWRLHLYCRDRGLKMVHDPEAWLTHLRVPSGGGRPGARNGHVLGDRHAWYTWCYFHFQHWGRAAFFRLARRYRWWIWHKKNLVRPWWIAVAHWELFLGLAHAVAMLRKGPQLNSREQ